MLYLVATPIGNLSDMPARALEVLGKVSVLACEDSRRTRILFSHFKLAWPQTVISYREHAEFKGARRILECLQGGVDVALCSDGGMPSISDPGYRVVNLVLEAGFDVTVIPGPSAVETALAVSGLSTSSYCFKGFPPRKAGALKRFFEDESGSPHTMVVFESPYRIQATMTAALEVLGDRKCAVCFELTKVHERVHRGYISDVIGELQKAAVKGEITLVIAGNNPKFIRCAT